MRNAARASGEASVASDLRAVNEFMAQPDDNGARYFAYQEQPGIVAARAELLLLRERLRRLEAFRQMVAAGPAGMTDYREWCDYVCERR